MPWILFQMPCSFSADASATGLKHCILTKMALCCTINGLMPEDINGQGTPQRSGLFPGRNTGGCSKDLPLTSQRQSGHRPRENIFKTAPLFPFRKCPAVHGKIAENVFLFGSTSVDHIYVFQPNAPALWISHVFNEAKWGRKAHMCFFPAFFWHFRSFIIPAKTAVIHSHFANRRFQATWLIWPGSAILSIVIHSA